MMLERALALEEKIRGWRRDFHMHPELSFEEHRTAGVVAAELAELDIRVDTGVGKTGVVGHIGEGAPVIAIRADMDALMINEANDVPYRSLTPGVMHACGHDAHTAILLGVAHLLKSMPDRPPGEVRLLFQPSEENWDEEVKSGATRMIEDGALAGVDAVIALHVDSSKTPGRVEISEGWDSAAVDSFEATIVGNGGHGAYPHRTTDPVFILAQVINAIWGIRARRIDPTRPAVISIGAVKGGEMSNVIPGEVTIRGTIRSYDEETRRTLARELDAALGVADALGGSYTLSIANGYPALYNDVEVSDLIREVARDIVGEAMLAKPEPGMGAEDFSYMVQLAPGAMFYLGARLDEIDRPHHSSIFDLDESAFPVGAAMLAETACRLLKIHAK